MILIAVIVVIAVPLVFCSARWLRTVAENSTRRVELPEESAECAFAGGMASVNWVATWPLARLEFLSWGIRLRGSFPPARWILGTWEARYDELATVRLISSISPSLRFAVKGDTEAVLFISATRRDEIMDRLEQHDVAVDRVAVPLSKAGGMYRLGGGRRPPP